MKLLLIIFMCIILSGCDPELTTVSTKPYKDNGTIEHAANTFVINSDKGRKFVPINLPEEYKINNIRVEFEGYVEKDNSLPSNLETIRLSFIKKLIDAFERYYVGRMVINKNGCSLKTRIVF